jgi:hypothetical protein
MTTFSFSGSFTYNILYAPVVKTWRREGNAFEKHVLWRAYNLIVLPPAYAITGALDLILGIGAAFFSLGAYCASALFSKVNPDGFVAFTVNVFEGSRTAFSRSLFYIFESVNPFIGTPCCCHHDSGCDSREMVWSLPKGFINQSLTDLSQKFLRTRAEDAHKAFSNPFVGYLASRAIVIAAFVISLITRSLDLILALIAIPLTILTLRQVEFLSHVACRGLQIHCIVEDFFRSLRLCVIPGIPN